eukprot:c9992_g1_i2.p1 GENE.c9992_g1_i2~~c9992_g1_i2.p1  ORF type:complete len:539 (+),score=144.13 c9992_g1_i2:206-1618(+)
MWDQPAPGAAATPSTTPASNPPPPAAGPIGLGMGMGGLGMGVPQASLAMVLQAQMFTQPGSLMSMLQQQQQELQALRQAKRLYVGGIPATVTEPEIVKAFNESFQNAYPNRYPDGGPALAISINYDKCFGFLELKSVEDADLGMNFDGISVQGTALKVRRPNDYKPVNTAVPGIPGIVSTIVPDSPDKIFISNLPENLDDGTVKELLTAFGPLRAFHLVRNPTTNESKGYAFALYEDSDVTDKACDSLNGLQVADKKLNVQRAGKGAPGALSLTEISIAGFLNLLYPFPAILQFIPGNPTGAQYPPTRVLCLLNIVEDDDLETEESFLALRDDIANECARFGTVLSVVIPHPDFGSAGDIEEDTLTLALPGQIVPKIRKNKPPAVPGQRKVFVEFLDVDSSRRAAISLGGRRYGGKDPQQVMDEIAEQQHPEAETSTRPATSGAAVSNGSERASHSPVDVKLEEINADGN